MFRKLKSRTKSSEWQSWALGHSMRWDSQLLTSPGHWQTAGSRPAEGSRAQEEEPFPSQGRLAGWPGRQAGQATDLPHLTFTSWTTFSDTSFPPAATH